MKNTFTFDLLGTSPQKLRTNLGQLAKRDFVFEQGKILNDALNNPNKQKRALTYIKGARQNDTPRNKKLLFAVHMHRQADMLENERVAMGGVEFTVGVDYQNVLHILRRKPMIGAEATAKKKKKKKSIFGKLSDIAKKVGKVALPLAKMVPGVGDAVRAAEMAVNTIPGVKDALNLANKVKGSIKQATASGDREKLEKLKDVVSNPKVIEAINIAKVVEAKIDKTVKQTKLSQASDVVDLADKFVPSEMEAAMKLVKAARELDYVALAQIRNIQTLADAGLQSAQKAIRTLKVASNIQKAAKEEMLDEKRIWQYW